MLDRPDHFTQVVRRDVGRHADGDTRRAVDEEVGKPRGQDSGFLQPVVEIRRECNRALVDVLQHRDRASREARLGVAIRRRAVPIHRAEVPLTVDQRIPQREVLHHADEGVVHGRVAVRVVLAEHVADHRRALLVRTIRLQAQLVHRVEDAAMDRLQPVAYIGQRTLDDDAHRVVDEGLPHLVLDESREDPLALVWCGHGRVDWAMKNGVSRTPTEV